MSSEQRRSARSRMGRVAQDIGIVLSAVALAPACGRGISGDPLALYLPHNDKPDASDAGDGGTGDTSLDDVKLDGMAEPSDASMPLSDAGDASVVDAPDARGEDAEIDRDDVEVTTDSLEERDDVNDVNDANDAMTDSAFDVDASDIGDGCTVACGWPDADYYVYAGAANDGDGSKLKPFKTITSAAAAYAAGQAQPKKVYVAAGTYDAALGEKFPIVLRGLSLEGAGRDTTFIVGTGILDHASEGGAFHDKYMVTVVSGDRILATHLAGVSLRPENSVPAPNYYGVLCDRGSATGEVAAPAGQTQLDNLTIGPGYHASVLATTSTVPGTTGCNVVINSSVLTGGWTGLRAQGCDTTMQSGPVVVEMGGPDPSSGNKVSWMQAPSNDAAGAMLDGCVRRGSFQNNDFVDSVYGILIDDRYLPDGAIGSHPFTINGNSFERLTSGGILALGDGHQISELMDNRFVTVSRAATQDPGPRAVALSDSLLRVGKVRRNQFIGNDFGVLLRAPAAYGQPANFGSTDDWGNNVFRCNSALRTTGGDFGVTGDTGGWGGLIVLVGNAWDHVPPTVITDQSAPNGCDIAVINAPTVTMDLRESSLATPACPNERVPGQ